MRILGFGTYDAAAHPRIAVLLDGLRARGHHVLERDVPLGLSTAQRVAMLRRPWLLPGLAARLADRWARLVGASGAFRGAAVPDAVVVGYLGHFDVVLARALWPRRAGAPVIVLDHLIFAAGTAVDRGAGEGLRTRALRVLDRAALAAADVIVLDTEEHLEVLRSTAPGLAGRAVVAPVGATRAWFDARRPPSSPRVGDGAGSERRRIANSGASSLTHGEGEVLRVVFYGLFTPLQGAPVIARALRELDRRGVHADVTLIGDGQDGPEVARILDAIPTTSRVRITRLAWVAADDLPGIVAAHEVCLGILGTTPKALAVVPNKVYQGAAAGCAVVSSDTAPQRRAFGGAAVLVPPGDHAALADALQGLAADRGRLAAVREACARVADERFSPWGVTDALDEALDEAHRGSRGGSRGGARGGSRGGARDAARAGRP